MAYEEDKTAAALQALNEAQQVRHDALMKRLRVIQVALWVSFGVFTLGGVMILGLLSLIDDRLLYGLF